MNEVLFYLNSSAFHSSMKSPSPSHLHLDDFASYPSRGEILAYELIDNGLFIVSFFLYSPSCQSWSRERSRAALVYLQIHIARLYLTTLACSRGTIQIVSGFHPQESLTDLLIPIAKSHNHPLQSPHQVQRDTLSNPQSLQSPTVECKPDT